MKQRAKVLVSRRIPQPAIDMLAARFEVEWKIDLPLGQDVHHATLGIFGMGRIGRALARRGGGFDMRLLYHEATRQPAEVERELRLDNVVLAPHIASASVATRRRMAMLAAENCIAALTGRIPPNLLNPRVLDKKM